MSYLSRTSNSSIYIRSTTQHTFRNHVFVYHVCQISVAHRILLSQYPSCLYASAPTLSARPPRMRTHGASGVVLRPRGVSGVVVCLLLLFGPHNDEPVCSRQLRICMFARFTLDCKEDFNIGRPPCRLHHARSGFKHIFLTQDQ